MRVLCLLLALLITPSLMISHIDQSASIDINITTKTGSQGGIKINGKIAAANLYPQDMSTFFHSIMVTLEYVEEDQEFPPLPKEYRQQQGFIYADTAAKGAEDANSNKNRIKLLIAPLEKKSAQIILPLDDQCIIPQSASRYRIVATLTSQMQGAGIRTIFCHDIHGPISLSPAPAKQAKNPVKKVSPIQKIISQPKGQSSETNTTILIKTILITVILLFIVLTVVLIFRSSKN